MNLLKLPLVLAMTFPVGFFASAALAASPADAAQSPATQPKIHLSAENQKHVDALTQAYLKAHNLLVHDQLDGVAANFQTIHDQANALAHSDNEALAKKSSAIADASAKSPKNLDAARADFKTISAAAFDLLKIAPPSASVAGTLYQMYCPMAQADWLQPSKDVANPYLGQDMPDCGVVQETLHGTNNK